MSVSGCRPEGRPRRGLGVTVVPFRPVEAAADDGFGEHVIGAGGYAHANSEIDLPFRRHVQIERRHELLRLQRERIEVTDRTPATVILQTKRNDLGEVPRDFGVGREAPLLIGGQPDNAAVEGGVDRPVKPALLLVDDGTNFDVPRGGGVLRALVAELYREASADWPVP